MIRVNDQGVLCLGKLHDEQKDFIRSTLLHTALIGGYQSGKSQAGTTKCIIKQLVTPGMPVAYYLPSYRLIKDMLVPKFETMFKEVGIRHVYKRQDSEIITRYGIIKMRSMENPDSIVAYSVGYSLVDEFDVVPVDKMRVAMGRIISRNSWKNPSGEPNSIDFVSTPEGFGIAHEFFVKKANDNKKIIRLSTLKNAPNLSSSYIQGLREIYTEEQLRAYLNGEFVNLTTGTVYKNFDRYKNHSDRVIKPKEVLHVGLDFNVTNMNAVINVIDGKISTAVAEITGVHDTPDMIKAIQERFPGHRIVCYPDASGQNKSTSSKFSDVQLLKKAKGFTVVVGKSNPFVKDRVNAMNLAFRDNEGEITQFVNTDNCPVLTEALEQQTYKGNQPDKSMGFDHINEAQGYFVFNKSKKSRRTTTITAG